MNEPENKHFEVYCKDCKHCKILGSYNNYEDSYIKFENCPPISDWLKRVGTAQRITKDGAYLTGGNVNYFQPPLGCNCFEPRDKK